MISCDNSLIQKEVAEKLAESTGILLDRSTISKKIKKIGISRKRLSFLPVERNSEQNINARAVYANEVLRLDYNNLVFLDETGFNKHTFRTYGYSKVNSKAYFSAAGNRGTNNSVLCVIGINGLISYEIQQGAYNSQRINTFITTHLVPYFRENPNKVLVMDNARFHHSREIQNLLNENNIFFKYLPPYSPMLNPIEEFFSMIKAKYAAVKSIYPNIEESIEYVLSLSYSSECANFYNHMVDWIEKARARMSFL